jgi:hypothetical protein
VIRRNNEAQTASETNSTNDVGPAPDQAGYQLDCTEVWGGNNVADKLVKLPVLASCCWSLGYQPLCSLVAALVDRTGNDRRRGRRAVFSEPDRLSRKPGNPSNEVCWLRLADPSWQPLAKNAPSHRSSVPRRSNSMSSIRDQVALVTGSSRGIGAAIAKSLAQQGVVGSPVMFFDLEFQEFMDRFDRDLIR